MVLIYILVSTSSASQVSDATNSALSATYKQSGLESYVSTVAQRLDKKYVPDYINDSAPVALILLQCIESHEVGWKWTF